MKNIFKRSTALLLSLLMVFSVCSTALIVYADEVGSSEGTATPQPETIKYVSIGDSMTNGYGFNGYNQDLHIDGRQNIDGRVNPVASTEHYDLTKYNFFDGTGVYGAGSYALQFEKYLAELNGKPVDYKGYNILGDSNSYSDGLSDGVDHIQLATSAFRTEDLAVYLGLENHLDSRVLPLRDGYFNNSWSYIWTNCKEHLTDHRWDDPTWKPGTSCGERGYTTWFTGYFVDPDNNFAYPTTGAEMGKGVGYFENQFLYLSNYFQSNLKDADVISLALGNASFGAYFQDRLFRIWEVMGAGGWHKDRYTESHRGTIEITIADIKRDLAKTEAEKAIVDKIYESMKTIVADTLDEELYSDLKMDRVCQLMTYVTFSYMYNYKRVIEWIGENNRTADVMIVGMVNANHGMVITGEGMEIDMGKGMKQIIDLLDTYVAGVAADYMEKNPEFKGQFLFVDQPENPELVANVMDKLDAAGWGKIDCGIAGCPDCAAGKACKNGRLDGEIVRYKTVGAFNSDLSVFASKLLADGIQPNDAVSDMIPFVELAYNTEIGGGKHLSDLPVPDILSIALDQKMIPADFLPYSYEQIQSVPAIKAGVIEAMTPQFEATVVYYACEKAMIEVLSAKDAGVMDVGALQTFANAAALQDLLMTAPLNTLTVNNATFGVSPSALTDIYEAYKAFFLQDNVRSLLGFFAHNKVGNGIAAHPTPANHDRLAANMIAAYENGYTVQDKCKAESDIIMVNDVYDTLSDADLLTQEQTDAIIDFFVDVMLGEKDSSTAYAFIYETLLSNEDDAKNIEVITTVYSILGEYGYLDPYADKTALIEAVLAIPAMAKVSDANFMNIVDCIFAAVTSGNEINAIDIAKSVYEIIFRNEPALDDVDKINIILGVYSLIKVDYLGDYEKELAVIEEIGANEKFKDIVTAQHAFAVVDKVYEVIKDGELSNEDIRIIANFVYFEVFGNVQKKARGGVFALTDFPVISAIDKLTIIEVVYDALGNYVPEETIPAFAAVKELYTAVKNADEITEDKLVEVIDIVVATYVDSETIGSDEITEATTKIADAILGDSTISAETKLALTNKVTETLKELGGAIGGGSTPIIPSIPVPDMTIVTKIFDRLVKEEKLLTDAEANQIINDIYPILLSGTIDKDAIASIVTSIYTVVFADDDLDLKQKTRVVTVVIEVVFEEYDIQGAYEYALKYATEMGYIDIAIDALDKAYAEAKQYAIEALAKVEICPEIKTELVAELANLNSLYEDAKAFVLANAGKLDLTIAEDSVAELNKKQLELYAALDDLDAAFKGILENGLEASFDAIEAAINGVAAEVVEIVAVVSPEGAVYVEQFMAEAKLFVEEVLYNTTHADYTVNKDSYYVALGNGEYVGSFVEKIAEKVKSEGVSYKFDEKDYKDLTSDAGIAALTEIIAANVADIAKADLISLGYTFDTAAENTMRIAIELIFKGETDLPTEFDWVELVGAEVAAEVEKVLATLRAELVAQGLDKTIDEIADVNLGKDITLADAAMAAVEYFAYNAVEYAVVMPQAVYAINEINPDAVIMINAMSNPIAGAKISLFGTELAFGDYINYVTDALYLETAAIAAVNKNVVFVPATEVKTTLTDKVITFNTDDLIELAKELGALITDLELNELIYATEEGNAYIAEQMFAALNITVEHSALLGDVNADGKINLLDAVGVVEYYIGNTVLVDVVAADVTGDGIVDLRDAVCIIEFYIGNINEFPAA